MNRRGAKAQSFSASKAGAMHKTINAKAQRCKGAKGAKTFSGVAAGTIGECMRRAAPIRNLLSELCGLASLGLCVEFLLQGSG